MEQLGDISSHLFLCNLMHKFVISHLQFSVTNFIPCQNTFGLSVSQIVALCVTVKAPICECIDLCLTPSSITVPRDFPVPQYIIHRDFSWHCSVEDICKNKPFLSLVSLWCASSPTISESDSLIIT